MNQLAQCYRASGTPGVTTILDQDGRGLSVRTFSGPRGTVAVLATAAHECAVVLVYGTVTIALANEPAIRLGPRPSPFTHMAHALLISGPQDVRLFAEEECLVLISSAPARAVRATQIIRPQDVRQSERGEQNWRRQVRLVCWSDNTSGEQLLIGETVTPSGNWSSVPPHQHQEYIAGADEPLEVPYEEAYFFLFSNPHGFALSRHFNLDESIDECYTLRNGDLLHVKKGYHPIVCAPGTSFYHLTMMAGSFRRSAASLHPDHRQILGNGDVDNPFLNQEKKISCLGKVLP
jgi:5-deoxy-glucuronate isomerase